MSFVYVKLCTHDITRTLLLALTIGILLVPGRAELRAGAAVVAIGVGSPVARLGADGRRRREARAAVSARTVGRAELATQVSRTKWFGWSWGRALWLVASGSTRAVHVCLGSTSQAPT